MEGGVKKQSTEYSEPILVCLADVKPDPPESVRMSGNFVIVCDDPECWLHITDFETHADLVKWIHHLSQKTWMTPRKIRALIDVVSRAKKWKVY